MDLIFMDYLTSIIDLSLGVKAAKTVWQVYSSDKDGTEEIKENSLYVFTNQTIQNLVKSDIQCHPTKAVNILCEDEFLYVKREITKQIMLREAQISKINSFGSLSKSKVSVLPEYDFALIIDLVGNGRSRIGLRASVVNVSIHRELKKIHKLWPGKTAQVYKEEEPLCGTPCYISHDDILSMICRYQEHEALYSILYPSRGNNPNLEQGKNIVDYWNALKSNYAGQMQNREQQIWQYLDIMGFPGGDYVFSAQGDAKATEG